MPLSNPVKPTFASVVTGTAVAASGLTGAASQSRLVGGNASGAPASGTFAVGDHVANADGTVYVCTVAGTPGTWVQVGIPSYGTPVALSGTASNGSATTVARSDHQHGGTVAFPLGSASAPSITPVSDADTGVWSPAANTFALSTGGTERVRVDSSGNVGIGTNNPNTPLHVYTSSQSAAKIQGTASNGVNFTLDSINQDCRFILANNSVPKWYYTNWASASHRLQIFDENAAEIVYLSQGGTSWTSASDIRLKDVDGPITNALAKVEQLTGVRFKWKREADNPNAKVRVGLIAQDVQSVLPEAVEDDTPDLITNEETGKVSGGLGVRYTELVPLLVNAIKELAVQHQQLQVRVANLEAQ